MPRNKRLEMSEGPLLFLLFFSLPLVPHRSPYLYRDSTRRAPRPARAFCINVHPDFSTHRQHKRHIRRVSLVNGEF